MVSKSQMVRKRHAVLRTNIEMVALGASRPVKRLAAFDSKSAPVTITYVLQRGYCSGDIGRAHEHIEIDHRLGRESWNGGAADVLDCERPVAEGLGNAFVQSLEH